ncbi:MAG: DUF1592 domain-containing protein [Planctomycetia bacterium]
MIRIAFRVLFFPMIAVLASPTRADTVSARARLEAMHKQFLATHCTKCHTAADANGGVRLDNIPLEIGTVEAAERWAKVLAVLNSGDMPPEDETQPADDAKAAFLETLSRQMVIARKALADTGGEIAMRRLNRREYVNTIRELLDVSVDARDLPADDDGGTFDTIGSSLFFSSDQFEHYLKLGRAALDEAIVTGPKPLVRRGRFEAEAVWTRRFEELQHRLAADNARAEEWKKSGRPATDHGFNDEEDARIHQQLYREYSASLQAYLDDPLTATGAMVQYIYGATFSLDTVIPHDAAPGRYILRARVGGSEPEPGRHRWLEYGVIGKAASIAELSDIGCVAVRAPIDAAEVLELPITVSRNGPRTFGIRERRHNLESSAAAVLRSRQQGYCTSGYQRSLWVDWIEWEGPFIDHWPPRSHELAIGGIDLAVNPGDEEVRAVIERFAARAFRGRPVKPAYVDGLMTQFTRRRAAGEPFVEAIKTPLAIVLASPSFLYMAEPVGSVAADASGSAKGLPLTAVELANRLSYFLWSSPPDDRLLGLATAGTLGDPDVVAVEVDRMLADERAMRFISGFTHQWLHMIRLDFFQFNEKLYPEFDASVKEAARREVYETIRLVLANDLPLRTLLESDFIVVNDLLADYYRLPAVQGGTFRRIPVPAGQPRGGLLGMAAILAMGSDGERSSPVERGAWVLRKLLHDPPPPAPANVPQLSRFVGKALPARALMTAHQEQPQCAQCHRRIDPIGYGLEHFNAAGSWRSEERIEPNATNKLPKAEVFPIDATGALPDGSTFDGFESLRAAVARHETDFARGLTEHLIEYALGRPVGFSDEELVATVLASAKQKHFTPRALIQAIVASPAFRSK